MKKSLIVHKIGWVDEKVYVYPSTYKFCLGQSSINHSGVLSFEWDSVTCKKCLAKKELK